ncbi:hypothetical protein EDD11_009442, partial [Mortierella claussenii]
MLKGHTHNASATSCPSPVSRELNEENLTSHTEHHKKLDQQRDFVAEYLEGLKATIELNCDPETGVVESDHDKLWTGAPAKKSASQQQQGTQPTSGQFHPQQRQAKVRPIRSAGKRKQVYKNHDELLSQYTHSSVKTPSIMRRRREISPTLSEDIAEKTAQKIAAGAASSRGEERSKKKRKQPPAIDVEVENLNINDKESRSKPKHSRPRGHGTQAQAAESNGKGAAKGTRAIRLSKDLKAQNH